MKRGTRGMGTLYEVSIGGVKYWQASRSFTETLEDGTKKRRRITGTGRTRDEAIKRLDERMRIRNGGTIQSRQEQQANKTLYKVWFYQWLTGIPEQRITDIVRRGYTRRGEMYLLPFIGNTAVEDLEPEDLRTLFDFTLPSIMKEDGTPALSEATLLNVFRVLQMSLTEATRRRAIKISVSPLAGIPAPKRNKNQLKLGSYIGMTQGLIKWMTARDHPDYCRMLFQWLGLRRSERLGLSWSDVHYLNNASRAYISVSSQIARYDNGDGWYLKRPKTASGVRDIPLTEPFLSALRTWKKKQEEWKKSENWNPDKRFENLVFLQEDGDIIRPNKDNADWRRILKDYGVAPDKQWRGHINRHITATLLAQNGVSPAIARKILGHATEAMTYYYTAITKSSMIEPMTNYGDALTARVVKNTSNA